MGAKYKYAKRQQLIGGTRDALSGAGVVEYFPVVGLGFATINTWDQELIPGRYGNLQYAYAYVGVAPGAGASRTFTLYVNGVPTAVTITIGGAGIFQNQDLINNVAVGPFDQLCWHSDGGVGAPAATIAYLAIGFTPF